MVSCQIVQHIAYSVIYVRWNTIMQFSFHRRWKRGNCRKADNLFYDIFFNYDSISSRGKRLSAGSTFGCGAVRLSKREHLFARDVLMILDDSRYYLKEYTWK